MKQEQACGIAGTSRKAEEAYLAGTLAVVRDNVQNYGQEVARMQESIDEMLEHYHDNDTEVLTSLNNTVTMHTHMKRALERNEKALKKPYFGRIVFQDEALDKEESLYIGRGGISKDTTHWMVVDWRAPVANAYYENGLGKCSYPAPGGVSMQIDLKLKRTYEIENAVLLDYYDSEVIANDELLTKYLAKNKQAVLGEIIATIQKEQNDIIRKSPYHNIIVQGVAGSGKTTVAMHRISYILYNYAERFCPEDFYIVGSNRILLDYITGVLPDLDVYGVRQMTMEQLFVRLLYEDWDETKYKIADTKRPAKDSSSRGSLKWFRELEDYCRRLEWETIPRESVYLNPRRFVEGFRDGKASVFDETGGRNDPKDMIELVPRDAVERYIRQNPAISVQSKINMLNERLMIRIQDEFLGKGVKYTEAERKAIRKAFRGRYGARAWKTSIYKLYRDFLEKQTAKGYEVAFPEKEFDVYDLAALGFLYKRVKETEVISEAHHIVIDEAQDFGMMAYSVLQYCIKDCTYTVMGDVSQNIHFGYGLNDWEELKALLLSGPQDSFGVLKKSYRNTVEISEFATNILHHGRFSMYPVEPIIRHGDPVAVKRSADRAALIREAAAVCRNWQEKGFDTIAVVCRDQAGAALAAAELGAHIPVRESDLEKAVFDSGIMVLPVEYTKGLEFDAVLILDPVRVEYPVDDGHAKLLYVAATRALHELCVLHTGSLTGLIADPLPKRAAPVIPGKPISVNPGKAAPANPGKAVSAISGKKRISIVRGESPGTHPAAPPAASEAGVRRRELQRPAVPKKPGPETAGGYEGVRKPYEGLDAAVQKQRLEAGRGTKKVSPAEKTGISFGDLPATEKLRPMGHSKIDLAVRWVTKQPDGLYLQSRYGVLRLSPIGGAIVRVTFAKGGQIAEGVHPAIAVRRTERAWRYQETAGAVEFMTEELCLRVDKTTGSVRYMTRDKKLLLAERTKESRQLENSAGGGSKNWLYLDWAKDENIYGLGAGKQEGRRLNKTAAYISHGESGELPFLISDKGYGILPAASGPVLCCDIPVYGSYLYLEKEPQQDYYFIGGKRQNTILNAFAYLCGRI